ncbi:sensor histidine kinase [Paenibacillus beijingensis]|uniref:histidine kinase n=1 Tax=Paenibacillus beijingensis TaxID=1126833 RepID=A0A0D5NEF5_9BACL|nr:histidine kinase [Paenibacillus beijingensis]AJY73545.1 histidine kinase [Paenibacillus beijingensis]
MTLKRRIFLIFSFNSLVPLICLSIISYYTMFSILSNKIEAGIKSSLMQVTLSLENSIRDLNHISQQFTYGGVIGNRLNEFMLAEEPYQRLQLDNAIKSDLNLLAFTNPNIGLTMYYFKSQGKYQFENFPVKHPFSPEQLPLLAEYTGISYYGPHISNNLLDNQYVLSALRKVELPDRDDVYIYVESGFQLTQNILDTDRSDSRLSHVIVDNNGRIAYSEVPDIFKTNSIFPDFDMGGASGFNNEFYWFKETSNQGWSLVSVIAEADYNKEKNRWFLQIALVSLLFLGVTLFLAWLLWKMVYKPLGRFHNEIKWMSNSRTKHNLEQTSIPEFDYLLNQFRQMKKQIWELFNEIEQKEKHRIDLEVEKLLYQINPHFLMNTLNTAHWLAVMNGQDEIDRLIQSLNKLLYYNLGKLGQASTIEEEIDALKQYLVLQQIRYDFQFNVRIDVDENVLKIPVPRFILQPLVENSLYHGLNDDGFIQVNVILNNGIEISIHDNGSGMSEEKIFNLLNSQTVDQQKVGMGIGMNYVKRMIKSRYEDKANLEIKSEIGKGTSIFLTLPIQGGETSYDQSACSR